MLGKRFSKEFGTSRSGQAGREAEERRIRGLREAARFDPSITLVKNPGSVPSSFESISE